MIKLNAFFLMMMPRASLIKKKFLFKINYYILSKNLRIKLISLVSGLLNLYSQYFKIEKKADAIYEERHI